MSGQDILTVSDVTVHYDQGDDQLVTGIEGANLRLGEGQVHGIVGGSGSGKSSLIRAILGLSAHNAVVSGRIELAGVGDLLTQDARTLRSLRGSRIGYIGQDGPGALHPLMTIGRQFRVFFRQHGVPGSKADHADRAAEALASVGLNDPRTVLSQHPFQLSGGMAQRVVIALATALNPALILADEPTSALDLTVQRTVLDLLARRRAELGVSMLLITHDLGVVAHYCDDVTVLHQGRVVESGPTREVFTAPQSAYTRRLLDGAGAEPEPSGQGGGA